MTHETLIQQVLLENRLRVLPVLSEEDWPKEPVPGCRLLSAYPDMDTLFSDASPDVGASALSATYRLVGDAVGTLSCNLAAQWWALDVLGESQEGTFSQLSQLPELADRGMALLRREARNFKRSLRRLPLAAGWQAELALGHSEQMGDYTSLLLRPPGAPPETYVDVDFTKHVARKLRHGQRVKSVRCMFTRKHSRLTRTLSVDGMEGLAALCIPPSDWDSIKSR